jgi:hypothetical protein
MNIYTNNEVGYRKNRSVERERCEPSEGFAGISSISNKEKKTPVRNACHATQTIVKSTRIEGVSILFPPKQVPHTPLEPMPLALFVQLPILFGFTPLALAVLFLLLVEDDGEASRARFEAHALRHAGIPEACGGNGVVG